MKRNIKNLILFLGSGITYDSGLPKIDEITHSLLNDKWDIKKSRELFPKPKISLGSLNLDIKIQPLLKLLKTYSDYYFVIKNNRNSNYEDLFYLLSQLIDEYSDYFENPALSDFINNIQNDCYLIAGIEEKDDLLQFFMEAQNLIQWVVYKRLKIDVEPKGLSLIKELALSDEIGGLDIFSLNHDLLLEKYLGDSSNGIKIKFTDGFSSPDGEIRFFDPDAYKIKQKVRLFKLHGSINWFLFSNVNPNNPIKQKVGIPMEYPKIKNNYRSSEKNSWVRNFPLFLVGTNNKIIDYEMGIFRELDIKFYQSLKQTDLIVMSGYGWNDIGVNNRIFDWLISSNDKRLCLLYKDQELFIQNPLLRFLGKKYGRQLINTGCWLSEMSLEELEKCCMN